VAVPEASPRIEPLSARHDRSRFVCGREALDQYFQRQVTQDKRRHLATPFVMVMPEGVIGGFYTLSSTALRLHDLLEDIAERLPRYPLVPATLLSACNRPAPSGIWGSFLLLDALHRSTRSQVASFAVIVDAIDDDARAFYVHESFLPLPDTPRRLFRRMSDIEALFK
jgi:hypothetical protein